MECPSCGSTDVELSDTDDMGNEFYDCLECGNQWMPTDYEEEGN